MCTFVYIQLYYKSISLDFKYSYQIFRYCTKKGSYAFYSILLYDTFKDLVEFQVQWSAQTTASAGYGIFQEPNPDLKRIRKFGYWAESSGRP